MKKTPWINEGKTGFFEYEIDLNGFHITTREKEDLQKEVTMNLHHGNYDKVSTYIKEHTYNEYWNEYTDEQRKAVSYFSLMQSRIQDEDYRNNVYNILVEQKEIIPEETSIDKLGYRHIVYTENDLKELDELIKNFPGLSQDELETIYRFENTECIPYLLMKESERNSERSVENYESTLQISEMLCKMYQSNKEMEQQLVSNSEMIVALYESNTKEDLK